MSNYPLAGKSAWYKTGELRIVPSWFGFMRAEEQWRQDTYDGNGLNSLFQTKWMSVGKLPLEVDNNIYSYICAAAAESKQPFIIKWRSLIIWLGGKGIKDPQPQSPAENQRWHRNLKRRLDEEQKERDKYPDED